MMKCIGKNTMMSFVYWKCGFKNYHTYYEKCNCQIRFISNENNNI